MALIEKIKNAIRDCDDPGEELAHLFAQAALTAIMDAGDGVQQCDRQAAKAMVFALLDQPDPDSVALTAMNYMARHRSTAAAAERARIVAAVERELAMTAMTNAEEANTDWIDGFEHAWKRAKVAIDRGEV